MGNYFWLSGLPNTFGGYDETPEMTAAQLKVCTGLYSVGTAVKPLTADQMRTSPLNV